MRRSKQALYLGVKRETLGLIAASVALDVVFDLLIKLDDGHDPQAPEGSPGWRLMETDPDGNGTGRWIDGFHAALLLMDPSGNDGKDIQ